MNQNHTTQPVWSDFQKNESYERFYVVNQNHTTRPDQCSPIIEQITLMNQFFSVNQNYIAQPVVQLQEEWLLWVSSFQWIKIIQCKQCSPIPEQMTLISQLFAVNQNQCNPIIEPITIMNRFLSVNQNHIAQPVIQLQKVTPMSHSFCSSSQ